MLGTWRLLIGASLAFGLLAVVYEPSEARIFRGLAARRAARSAQIWAVPSSVQRATPVVTSPSSPEIAPRTGTAPQGSVGSGVPATSPTEPRLIVPRSGASPSLPSPSIVRGGQSVPSYPRIEPAERARTQLQQQEPRIRQSLQEQQRAVAQQAQRQQLERSQQYWRSEAERQRQALEGLRQQNERAMRQFGQEAARQQQAWQQMRQQQEWRQFQNRASQTFRPTPSYSPPPMPRVSPSLTTPPIRTPMSTFR